MIQPCRGIDNYPFCSFWQMQLPGTSGLIADLVGGYAPNMGEFFGSDRKPLCAGALGIVVDKHGCLVFSGILAGEVGSYGCFATTTLGIEYQNTMCFFYFYYPHILCRTNLRGVSFSRWTK